MLPPPASLLFSRSSGLEATEPILSCLSFVLFHLLCGFLRFLASPPPSPIPSSFPSPVPPSFPFPSPLLLSFPSPFPSCVHPLVSITVPVPVPAPAPVPILLRSFVLLHLRSRSRSAPVSINVHFSVPAPDFDPALDPARSFQSLGPGSSFGTMRVCVLTPGLADGAVWVCAYVVCILSIKRLRLKPYPVIHAVAANPARGQLSKKNSYFAALFPASEFDLARQVRPYRPMSACPFSDPRSNLVPGCSSWPNKEKKSNQSSYPLLFPSIPISCSPLTYERFQS